MELTALTPRDRARMGAALRRGEPVRLDLRGPFPRDLRVDEVAPLCHEARAADADLDRALAAWAPPPARPRPELRVTAVIPCSRGRPLGVRALLAQDVAVRVIVLSNGPGGPREVPGAEVIRVPWEGHGRTRARALAHVRDPWVLFTVDDALPLGAGFVRTLVEAAEAGGFDAVMARQVPWPDSDPVTRRRLRAWTPAGRTPVEVPQVDDVAALYRTEVLRRAPFPDVPIAEDLAWSRDHRTGYAPRAPVAHAHRRRPAALFARERAMHAMRVRLGLPPTVPDLRAAVGALPGVLRPVLAAGPAELPNQLAELAGQWLGARDARRE